VWWKWAAREGGRPEHDMKRGSETAPGVVLANESSVRLRR
jgi:hypothetical protein